MSFPIRIIGLFSVCLLLMFPHQLLAQESSLQDLQDIEKKTKAESIALGEIIKKVYPEYSQGLESYSVNMLKIISNQCRVRETIDRSSQVIYSPTINEEFKILNHDDNYYQIELGDGRKGWIHETCGQVISETVERSNALSVLSSSDVNKYLDFSEIVYQKIIDNKVLAERVIEKNNISKNNKSYKNILKYHSLAQGIYEKYLRNRSDYIVENFPFKNRISGSSELLLGKASFNQSYLDGVQNDYDEGNQNFAIFGNYIITPNANVNVSLTTQSSVLQTPYKTSDYGVGLNYTGINKVKLNTGINFNSYDDDLSTSNDYGRFLFHANVRHLLSPKSNFLYNYSFMKNNYKVNDENDYSNHKLSAVANLKLNPISKVIVSMLANIENSDSEYHQFVSLLPSVTFQKKIGDKKTDLKFRYENISYEDLELRDYSRFVFAYKRKNIVINKRKTTDFSVSSKTYPNNDISNYFNIKTKFTSAIISEKNKRNALSLYTSIYPNATDNSYTDVRFDHNVIAKVFSNFSAYYRLWHNTFESDDDSTNSSTPSVIDLSSKFGFKVGPLRVGPTIGLHAVLDFDADDIVEQDGNLLRIGGVAEGTVLLPKMINLSFMAAYDYGMVYNEELTVASSTGEITLGEIQERHPTTLQISTTISAPLAHNLELIGRISYYKINTDMDETLSINPIKFTEQMSLQIGIRYRYN